MIGLITDQAKQQRLGDNSTATTLDEAGYSTFEMRQSRRGTMKSTNRGTLKSTTSRRSNVTQSTNFAMISGARNPPRPAPSMVNYSDEDSAKGYDENPDDSDSLTEKPSEISSTDSQVLCLFSVVQILATGTSVSSVGLNPKRLAKW